MRRRPKAWAPRLIPWDYAPRPSSTGPTIGDMTSVASLGLHEPSALPYLVTESILPPDPSPSLYRWTTTRALGDDGIGMVEEEILTTDQCAVWSRNGAIKRVFNLRVEGEPILHAFVTEFGLSEKKDDITDGTTEQSRQKNGSSKPVERGIVVVLKTQAHVFLLSGDGYVIPLSFEVESAFPFPSGFILQRTLEEEEITGHSIPMHHDLSTINETLTSIGGVSSRPSLILPDGQQWSPKLIRSNAHGMPRTFSYTQAMSELGLVVWSANRKGEALDDCKALPRSERVLFVSRNDELGLLHRTNRPLCMALTLDEKTSTFTLWHVSPDTGGEPPPKRHKPERSKPRASLRKSSNIYGRDPGNAPVAARGPGILRESLGGSGQHYSEGGLFSSLEEQNPLPTDDLASQLGPEFGDVGVQTRSARRVSSMLARTDLGSATDRSTFNDLATGHAGRQSLNRASRRGESIGSFNDRQSFGYRRRSSFPTTASAFSTGNSFLDVSARGLLEEMDPLRQSTRLEEDVFDGSESKLPRDIGFFKIKTFPRRQTSDNSRRDLDVKVVTLETPELRDQEGLQAREIWLSVMDKALQELTLIRVLVKVDLHKGGKGSVLPKRSFELKATEVRRLPGIKDVCKVVDGSVQRLVVLTESRSRTVSLQLEAPWSPSFRVELPPRYAIHNPLIDSEISSPRKDRDTGMSRMIPGVEVQIQRIHASGYQGQIYVSDQDLRRHSVWIRLAPRDPLVHDILRMADMVLNMDQHESLLVAFWEVSRWLESKKGPVRSEWVAMVVVLFSLAVPFINNQLPPSTPSHRRKANAFLRSSSGSAIDLTNYDAMQNDENDTTSDAGMHDRAWNWLLQGRSGNTASTPKSKRATTSTTTFNDDANDKKDAFLINCVTLAKEYIQSPSGESALGPEGYLPTATNKEREQRCTAIPSILLGLQLLYEESKLDTMSTSKFNKSRSNLVMVMAQLGRWVGWKDWTSDANAYYEFESSTASTCLFDHSIIDGLQMPAQPFEPPSFYNHLEKWINGTPSTPFLTLGRISGASDRSKTDDPVWRLTAELTPRTIALLSFMQAAGGQTGTRQVVPNLLKSGIDEGILDTLPDGVAAAFQQAISSTRNRIGGETEADGRFSIGSQTNALGFDPTHPGHRPHLPSTHEAQKDYHSICVSALEAEALQRWDASSEADRHAVTRLIFNKDRRFPEASKMVNQTRPPVVECTPEPEWSEVDLLEAQKELAQHVTRRTLSVAAGRGMMHFNARVPLLTERVPIPAFSLQCVMKPRNATESAQAMTFSADKASFTEEKVCWAFFHNGASMGLMIASDAQGIDTSWILYNKPPELTNRHAGFLLALGLNGHLKTLAKWVAFKYLTPKHTMTSVGLLLGLSASFLGTMDTLITRLLSVHVTRLLPPGAAELNLSPLTQTTGIMGIGLLYHNSQHRRMSEVMLSEIENNDAEEGTGSDIVLRDEGYRLAAGFSLGLVNLGQGKRLHGLHDMDVAERLLTIAVGTKNVNMVHVLDRATAGAVMALAFIFLKTNDEAMASKVDVPDTLHQFDYVRPDIFLLRTLARHLIMWDSIVPTDDFIKKSLPEPYRRRVDLKSTKFLCTEDMPFFNIVAGICFAIGLRFAGSQRPDARDLLVSYLDQFLRLGRLPSHNYDARVALNSVRNCLDTIALATASVMAGSGDLIVMRRLRALHGRTDKDTPFGSHLAGHMALGALFLAGGTRTFGTSNLAVASLCIAFYPVFPSDVLDNRGHLQALRHLWVLAVEGRCLVARDGDAGGAVVGGVTGIVHLKDGTTQSIQLPGLLPEFDTIRSVDVKGEGFWHGHIDFEPRADGGQGLRDKIQAEKAVNIILRRRSAYDQPPRDLFTAELQALSETQGIPSVDPNSAAAHAYGIGGASGTAGGTQFANPFEWVFELDSFQGLDHAEGALILGPAPIGEWNGKELLRTTVVDSRLALEEGVLPLEHPNRRLGQGPSTPSSSGKERTATSSTMQKDQLWQLRLVFAWFDRWEREDEEMDRDSHGHHESHSGGSSGGRDEGSLLDGTANENEIENENRWFTGSGGSWLRREVIERLKWRVWRMATGGDEDGDEHGDVHIEL